MPGGYGFIGVDIKFHDYLGVKLEGSYHYIKGSETLNDQDFSGIMLSLGSWVYF